ncbi:MAG: polyprenyl synthetase family protein [Cryomorphaceae bacterium]|nr:polyprenyl synthetase family protein [Cryomorphaceae bacterium]
MKFVKDNVDQQIAHYQHILAERINAYTAANPNSALYAPIGYMMELKAKRWRPMFLLACAEGYGASAERAMPAALAIEVFHNFTLMHDDIMDNAPLRRGQQTVHEKWSTNTAILSGDAMIVQAYQLLADVDNDLLAPLMLLFNSTALEVCEGQQMDMDFESRQDVHIDEYMEMIRLKTSVLLAAAVQMGAICGNKSEEQQRLAYAFGEHFGLAFQLRDDYLDVFGNPNDFGKQVGGDILADKKTFIYLHTCEADGGVHKNGLLQWHGTHDPEAKITSVKEIFRASGADDACLKEIAIHSQAASEALGRMEIAPEAKIFFTALLDIVQTRTV